MGGVENEILFTGWKGGKFVLGAERFVDINSSGVVAASAWSNRHS